MTCIFVITRFLQYDNSFDFEFTGRLTNLTEAGRLQSAYIAGRYSNGFLFQRLLCIVVSNISIYISKCIISSNYSDGVGRAGTYVLIDMVLNRMAKGCKEIDIAATLEHIRDQRSGMVQTRPQFEFCLMAVAEEVHAILKALLP